MKMTIELMTAFGIRWIAEVKQWMPWRKNDEGKEELCHWQARAYWSLRENVESISLDEVTQTFYEHAQAGGRGENYDQDFSRELAAACHAVGERQGKERGYYIGVLRGYKDAMRDVRAAEGVEAGEHDVGKEKI